MLFNSPEDMKKHIDARGDEGIDEIIYNVYFNEDIAIKQEGFRIIFQKAKKKGIYPASIHRFYTEYVRKEGIDFTVPAFNIRFLPYHSMRRIFRSALKKEVGPFVIEIARSEVEYTGQSPLIYSACVFASALKEGYTGPVFIQGDHFQLHRERYLKEPEEEKNDIKRLIKEAILHGFLNIDIDASTLVDVSKEDVEEEQKLNGKVTAEMTEYIRSMEPGVHVSIGGEIGEIGGRNSTPDDLRGFMSVYTREITKLGVTPGLSKISIQTGTRHGGVVLPDGKKAEVNVDFEVIKKLSRIAREEFGMGGAVQHGASTLPDNLFYLFPEFDTLEIHLATEFQNIVLDHPRFPKEIKKEMENYLFKRFGKNRGEESEAQFLYRHRKYCAKEFNRILWDMEDEIKEVIVQDIEKKVDFYFDALNVSGKREILDKVCKEGFIIKPDL